MSPVDFSIFWYTYSTIAQTLAGAFGFLVAVVLFRLQMLDSQWTAVAARMIEALGRDFDPHRLNWVIREKNILLFLDEYKQPLADYRAKHSQNQELLNSIDGMVAECGRYQKTNSTIRNSLRYSLRLSTVTIIMCFILLPLTTPIIIRYFITHDDILGLVYGYCGLAVTILLSILCIKSYVSLAMKTIAPSPRQ